MQVAQQFGVEEAVIIHNLFHWISKNAANEQNQFDGFYWTFNSIKAYSALFPYLNETKIKRIFKNLEEKGCIIKGNFNDDKWDKTNWYTFPLDSLFYLQSVGYNVHWVKMTHSIGSKCTNREEQNDQMILINNTDSKPYSKQKEEDTNVSPKKNNYIAIIECWNKYNGDKLGRVTKITDRRKNAIKHMMEEHDLSQEQFERILSTIPSADSWLYNPNKMHKNWKPDFDWWMANTNGWFTKLIEGKCHTQNPQAFSVIMDGDAAPYTPQCGGALQYNDYYKCYLYTGYWGGYIPDGYTDDNRPDGASVMLNNARGTVVWHADSKKWEVKK